jgi:predicted nucleic acid-binding protein
LKKLIVDANILGIFFDHSDFKPVYNVIKDKRWVITYGGTKQLEEYKKAQKYHAIIVELGRSGRAILENLVEIDDKMNTIVKACKSDDPHIIALAQVSGARLLCSYDEDLGTDFTNSALIKPRGRVYKNAGHAHLLRYKK